MFIAYTRITKSLVQPKGFLSVTLRRGTLQDTIISILLIKSSIRWKNLVRENPALCSALSSI